MQVEEDINRKVTIVIPTKNEEAAIESVIDELHSLGFYNILVVDGFSTDRTVELAKKKGARVIHQIGKGKTGALKTAIINVDTPYMVVIDGDYTYDASSIKELLRYSKSASEVIAVRVPISEESMSGLHRFGNRVLTLTFNILMGTRINDVCSGLYLLNSDVAKRLRLEGAGFDVEAEIAAQIARMGNIAEVSVNYRPRLGREKLSTWKHGYEILKSIIKFGIKYNRGRFYKLAILISIMTAGIVYIVL